MSVHYFKDPFTDGEHANTDRVAVTFATAVLFPLAARETFMPKYTENKLTLVGIADQMELSLRYCSVGHE
jgi:hypothetical protein